MNDHQIGIVGGGLAGLTAAIALSRYGYDIAVFESNPYPHHKVCGEYLSNEILPYLNSLGVDLIASGGKPLSRFEISSNQGKIAACRLSLGGVGISRYALDNLLYETAKSQKVTFYFEKVQNIRFNGNSFTVESRDRSVVAPIVIGAYGKRSGLDKALHRSFIQKKTHWLAIKAHYAYPEFPDDLVALHNFKGGYGGLSKTEKGHVNFCYLARYDVFKEFKEVSAFNEKIVSQNPHLKHFLGKAEPVFEHPLSIGQISFERKKPIVNNVLMSGDTAGLIHPLCGNGMAMAIHAGKLVSGCVHGYFNGTYKCRRDMEEAYQSSWNTHFKRRLLYGRYFQKLLLQDHFLNWGIPTFGRSEGLLQQMIIKTHGKMVSP
ncbi:NAD(P)/FAD-dependent oxidoreductase [Maribacter aurantiacus]|uniref:NAD(P)/FAD-dependent oxidoreductase n=1 Tax=Maribacter aurantiacus TaxID=1882343 RepID=A0A5R8M674_9FLAO|nr:NAD(P)/FAD-dependent oxidoreductase [Maribacter aurantiacus]TLF45062.1 NAD(P)/FAD-dependent oxidoreductase [Maribacter aurantiacus]